MDKCLIMTTGRTGSDYLHACLDDINGVMTLCGKFDYHQFFNGPSDKIDKIVVATTDQKNDDIIENYVNKLGIECYRGDSNNVLDRFYQCAKKYNFSL